MDADYNFRFALSAAEAGLIDAETLLDAGREWRADGGRSLAEILVEKRRISRQDAASIDERLRRDGAPPLAHDAPTATTGPRDDDGTTVIFEPHSRRGVGGSGGLRSTVDADSAPGWEVEGGDGERDAHGFGSRYAQVRFHVDGGIGRVWRVMDRVLGREVALKQLRPDKEHAALSERRFVEEARITSRLVHPNIVPIHDLAAWAESPFYVMKFVEGRTLKEAVRAYHRGKERGRIDPAAAGFRALLDAFLGVCNAIAFAHAQGVIHRDIKGQNVILGTFGEVIVLDWGLAKRLADADDPLAEPIPGLEPRPDRSMGGTLPGQAIGTPNYMPPEQAEGDHARINERSDVFGLGALLYYLLTDHPPFDGTDTTVVLRKALQSTPPAPRSLNATVPPALEAICRKAMAKDPQARYESAMALADDVRRWLNDEPVSVHRDRLSAKVGRWSRKNQPVVAALGAPIITGALGVGIGSWLVAAEAKNTLKAERDRMTARGGEQANFQAATRALSQVLGIIVTDLPQVRDRNIDLVRSKAATTIGAFVDEIAGRYRDDPDVPMLLAGFLREAAKLRANAFQFAEAEALYRRAIAILAPGGDGAKLAHRPRDLVTEIRISLAESMLARGAPRAAEPHASEALRIIGAGRKADPDNPALKRTEARVLLLQAELAQTRGKPDEAERRAGEALSRFDALIASPEIGPFDPMLAMIAQLDRGVALRGLGRLDKAATALIDAGKRADDLLTKDSQNVDYRQLSALVSIERGRTLTLAGKRREALEQVDDGLIETLKTLVADRPTALSFPMNLAYARIVRAVARDDGGSREDLEAAVKDLNGVLDAAPESPSCQGLRGRAKVELARLALDRNEPPEARRLLGEAAADLKAVLDANPQDGEAAAADAAREALLKRLPGR